jgi:hypothetical protein
VVEGRRGVGAATAAKVGCDDAEAGVDEVEVTEESSLFTDFKDFLVDDTHEVSTVSPSSSSNLEFSLSPEFHSPPPTPSKDSFAAYLKGKATHDELVARDELLAALGEVEAEPAVVEGVDIVAQGEAGVTGEGDVAVGVAAEGVDSRVEHVGVDEFAHHHPGVARLNNSSFGSAPRRVLDAQEDVEVTREVADLVGKFLAPEVAVPIEELAAETA